MQEYKISIIVPVYNVEQYIDEAMKSIISQTIGFQNLQVIFSDDCSTDKSREIIDTYAEKYSNVIAIHLQNHTGAAGTPRNEALKRATAPYIMFCDPDDYYENNACEFLYKKAEETGAEIVDGDHKAIDENGDLIYSKWPNVKELQSHTFHIPVELKEVVKYRGSFVTKIYRRSFLYENYISFPEHIPGQDLVFYCRCLTSAKRVEYFSEPVYVYRFRSKENPSISNVKTEKFFIGINECYRLCFDTFIKAERMDCFDILIYGVLDDYIAKMIDSEVISEKQIINILKAWHWLFSYVTENGIEHANIYSDMIIKFIILGNYETAAHIIFKLKPFRSYLNEVMVANSWLKAQVDNYQKNAEEKEQAIRELLNWTKELEKTKLCLEKQINNKEEVIVELKDWTKALEEGKNYLEEQVNERDEVIAELKGWIEELEDAKRYLEDQWNKEKLENKMIASQYTEVVEKFDELNNTISRQKYKLNVLLNDIGVQKIIKKKKYNI